MRVSYGLRKPRSGSAAAVAVCALVLAAQRGLRWLQAHVREILAIGRQIEATFARSPIVRAA